MTNKVEQFTQQAINIANDNKHGYSQYNRWGNPDYDCSGLVIAVVQNTGIPVKTNGATYTGNMYQAFLMAGFKDVTKSINLRTGQGLIRGDILLNPKHHTEIYIHKKQHQEMARRGEHCQRPVGIFARRPCRCLHRHHCRPRLCLYPLSQLAHNAVSQQPLRSAPQRHIPQQEGEVEPPHHLLDPGGARHDV